MTKKHTNDPIVNAAIERACYVFAQLGDNREKILLYARFLEIICGLFENLPDGKRARQMRESTDPEFIVLMVEEALDKKHQA